MSIYIHINYFVTQYGSKVKAQGVIEISEFHILGKECRKGGAKLMRKTHSFENEMNLFQSSFNK